MMLRQWLLSILLLPALAACSPYNYGKEVAEFSKDVGQITDAYKSGYAGLAADYAAQTRRLRILDRSRLSLTASCEAPVSDLEESKDVCTLGPPTRGNPEPMRPRALQLDTGSERTKRKELAYAASVLQDYVQGLAAVTNAEDRAALDKSFAQLADAVGGFSQFAPGIGTLAPTAINLFGWLVGTALDQQRFDALKAAVEKVGTTRPDGIKPIHAVQAALSDGLARINRQRRDVIRAEADILVWGLSDRMSEDAYAKRLAEVEALVAVLEGLRRADPKKAGEDLEKAHDALVAAVRDPRRQYSTLLKALNDFKDKATALKAAIGATPAATSKKGD